MTDHADTIRAAELRAKSQLSHFASGSGDVNFCDRCGKPLNQWDGPCEQPPTLAALLANDVLVLVAERQKAIDLNEELLRWKAQLVYERKEARAERQQAIDALREIADHVPGRYVVQSPDYVQLRARARAALLSLGEQQ